VSPVDYHPGDPKPPVAVPAQHKVLVKQPAPGKPAPKPGFLGPGGVKPGGTGKSIDK